ncbi:MAG TPA: hypothetical protein VIP57_03950 [Candidatus Dormibacteraeota bacterium]
MVAGWGKDGHVVLWRGVALWAFAFTILALLSLASHALAISAPIHVANTGGEGVYIRPDPNTSRAPVGWMPEGASPDFHCFSWGQNINGVPIWFNVTYGGATGFYASYYDDSSYHSNEELTAKYGVPLCGSAPPSPAPAPTPSPAPTPPPSDSPAAPGGRVFNIVNAEEGVYYRDSPSWGDTKRTPGVGVYNGDRVETICGAFGDAVGPYSDRAWSKVRNLTRPTTGEGWVNEHFIDDGAPSNGWPAGVPQCGTPPPPAPPSSGPKSVFYSPNETPTGVGGLATVADSNLTKSQWSWDGCSTAKAVDVPESVNTLAGWSLGRLGPIYFLSGASRGRWEQVHRIVLFDPGNADEMAGSCDVQLPQTPGVLLAAWLRMNPQNRLTVFTGAVSEEHAFHTWGRSNFGGLWHYYFASTWNQPFAGQVQVCDYNNVDHKLIFIGLSWFVKYPVAGCPSVPSFPAPVAWHS